MEPNYQTALQQFMAAAMANNNIVIVADSAKTRLPECFRKSCYPSSPATSDSRRKKSNPEKCRWGETSSDTTASSLQSMSCGRRASDSALVLPKVTARHAGETMSEELTLIGMASSQSSIKPNVMYSSPTLRRKRHSSKKDLPEGGQTEMVCSRDREDPARRDSLLQLVNPIHLIQDLGMEKQSSKPLTPFNDVIDVPANVMDSKGHAIIAKVIALSRKAAWEITKGQARCEARSAISA